MTIDDLNPFELYVQLFGENFPVYADMPEGKTHIEVAQECVDRQQSFKAVYQKGKSY